MSAPFLRALVGDFAGIAGRVRTAVSRTSTAALQMLVRLAHLPSAFCNSQSRGYQPILKAKTLVARLVVQPQRSAMAAMLTAVSEWRSKADGNAVRRFVVLGMSHQWDDSPQQLREMKPVPSAKAAKQRISKSVLVQRSIVQCCVAEERADGGMDTANRAENFIVPHGKSAEWLRGAMLASSQWRGPVDIEDQAAMRSLSGSCDAVILALWPDGGSPNGRWIRHVIATGERDCWGASILVDPTEVCLLHQIRRIKASVLEAQATIGMAYCLSRLVRSGTVWAAFADNLTKIVEQSCERLPLVKPPAEAAQLAERVRHAVPSRCFAPRQEAREEVVLGRRCRFSLVHGQFWHGRQREVRALLLDALRATMLPRPRRNEGEDGPSILEFVRGSLVSGGDIVALDACPHSSRDHRGRFRCEEHSRGFVAAGFGCAVGCRGRGR